MAKGWGEWENSGSHRYFRRMADEEEGIKLNNRLNELCLKVDIAVNILKSNTPIGQAKKKKTTKQSRKKENPNTDHPEIADVATRAHFMHRAIKEKLPLADVFIKRILQAQVSEFVMGGLPLDYELLLKLFDKDLEVSELSPVTLKSLHVTTPDAVNEMQLEMLDHSLDVVSNNTEENWPGDISVFVASIRQVHGQLTSQHGEWLNTIVKFFGGSLQESLAALQDMNARAKDVGRARILVFIDS